MRYKNQCKCIHVCYVLLLTFWLIYLNHYNYLRIDPNLNFKNLLKYLKVSFCKLKVILTYLYIYVTTISSQLYILYSRISHKPGSIEILQDRILPQDDGRGVDQPLQDSVLTENLFRILLERRKYQETNSVYVSSIS